MNPTLHHKTLSFYLTSLCFLPLAIVFFVLPSYLRIKPVNQENFTLSMQQFITQNAQNAIISTLTQKQKEIPKPLPQEHKKYKKKHKRNPAKQTTTNPMQTQTQTSQTLESQATTNTDSTNTNSTNTGQTTQTLSYGKDNHPFLKAVKSAIDSHTKYPRQARKMRIQGKVVVGFLWTKQRELRDLKILKSSGHNLVDENSLHTIQKASRSFPTYTNNVRLQIPIIYQLED